MYSGRRCWTHVLINSDCSSASYRSSGGSSGYWLYRAAGATNTCQTLSVRPMPPFAAAFCTRCVRGWAGRRGATIIWTPGPTCNFESEQVRLMAAATLSGWGQPPPSSPRRPLPGAAVWRRGGSLRSGALAKPLLAYAKLGDLSLYWDGHPIRSPAWPAIL